MKKPNNWETTQAYGTFEKLELGGHICEIKEVKETKSKNGKDMLVISLDIAEGAQKGYYAKLYRESTRENKKWGCVVYQLIEDNEGNTNKGLKTFIEAVKKSNPGFDENKIWDCADLNTIFKGKRVGGVFGREQYKNMNGELRWSTKCTQFRDIETIKKGVEVPEDKYLPGQNLAVKVDDSDFDEIISDDDLPF